MGATKEIREVRCADAIGILDKDRTAVFFTLTTPDRVDYHTIRERWRHFRNTLLKALRRAGQRPQYVMNYELHPGYLQKIVRDPRTVERVISGDGISHGWHIHGVISCFVPHSMFLRFAESAGFGRVDFRRVRSRGIYQYLTKHALKAYRGLTRKERSVYAGMRNRLVNTSRGLPSLDSYHYQSELIDITKTKMRQFRLTESKDDLFDERKIERDYRVLHCYAEICAMLDYAHQAQVAILHEWLSCGMPVLKALKVARNAGQLFT